MCQGRAVGSYQVGAEPEHQGLEHSCKVHALHGKLHGTSMPGTSRKTEEDPVRNPGGGAAPPKALVVNLVLGCVCVSPIAFLMDLLWGNGIEFFQCQEYTVHQRAHRVSLQLGF